MVKEVERLKKNREERRAKQQEIMEEKEKAIEMNANHANYDFFCMIQDYQEQLEYNPLTEEDPIMDHQVSRTIFSMWDGIKLSFIFTIQAQTHVVLFPNFHFDCPTVAIMRAFTSTGRSRAWRKGSQCWAAPGSPCGPCAPPPR